MRNGDFVARDLVVDLVVKAIIIQDAAAGTLTNDTIEGYFVTGFPRDLDQAHHFESRVSNVFQTTTNKWLNNFNFDQFQEVLKKVVNSNCSFETSTFIRYNLKRKIARTTKIRVHYVEANLQIGVIHSRQFFIICRYLTIFFFCANSR